MAEVLAQGMEEGLGVDALAKRLRREVGGMARERAKTIAWTETAFAYGAAQEKLAEEVGAQAKRWLTANDDRVCDLCRANQEQGKIPKGQSFVSGAGWEPQHPTCRCTTLLEDVSPRVPAVEPAFVADDDLALASEARRFAASREEVDTASLAQRAGVSENQVRTWRRKWLQTSSYDEDMVALQIAAKEEFGLAEESLSRLKRSRNGDKGKQSSSGKRMKCESLSEPCMRIPRRL